ncbi:hypothetical protein [Nocardioides lijunqiniae]|uniref:hypothetical protein n=1 Tax=Nocardioides lijunqiniae TaxID=2760832 RepID=UPI001877D18D|nr:hypothetical protein [Nocardioides lijunqiniae]
MARNTLSRSLHDVGLAAWFGGTLANAVALNPAAAQAHSSSGTPMTCAPIAAALTGVQRSQPVLATAPAGEQQRPSEVRKGWWVRPRS